MVLTRLSPRLGKRSASPRSSPSKKIRRSSPRRRSVSPRRRSVSPRRMSPRTPSPRRSPLRMPLLERRQANRVRALEDVVLGRPVPVNTLAALLQTRLADAAIPINNNNLNNQLLDRFISPPRRNNRSRSPSPNRYA